MDLERPHPPFDEPWTTTGRSLTQLLCHVVWSTPDRRPLISPHDDEWLALHLLGHARSLGCDLRAVGNASDHVHLLLQCRPTLSLSEAVQRLKVATTRAWAQRGVLHRRLAWGPGYWAESCDPRFSRTLEHYLLAHRTFHGGLHDPEPWECVLRSGD